MEMTLKFAPGVRPTQEQALEIAQVVMAEPDMGWDWDLEHNEPASVRHKSYDVQLDGEYGTYHYRVNLSWELITILSVK